MIRLSLFGRNKEEKLEVWKEEGYIKKTKLEEAREYAFNCINQYHENNTKDRKQMQYFKDLYEAAIEEIRREK